jgi:hypothetical protein
MKVAIGLKAHSGWAALVALGENDGELEVAERSRIELVEPGEVWAKAPYHASEGLEIEKARDVVKRSIEGARRIAARELRAAVARLGLADRQVVACAVLTGAGMPHWSVDEILAVHFRMHKAEGELFRDALVRAAGACELSLARLPEKQLDAHAAKSLGVPAAVFRTRLATLGRSIGAPWGKDQKDAALAAWIALRGGASSHPRGSRGRASSSSPS